MPCIKVKNGYRIQKKGGGLYPKVYPTLEACQLRVQQMEMFKKQTFEPTKEDVYVPGLIKIIKKKKKFQNMPIEETEKYIRIRIKNPEVFDRVSFRTIDISKEEGIKAVVGCPKGNYKAGRCQVGVQVQSYLFETERWTPKKAENWVKEAQKKISSEFKMFVYPTDIKTFSFTGERTSEIQVLPYGFWNHPTYGKIEITQKNLKDFVENFEKGIRRDLPITEGHIINEEEKPAIGWFKKLINKGREGLWAIVEWTDKGLKLLKEKSYKYFSPEFYTTYKDPESGQIFKNILVGGALTNRPYFKGMQAVVLSEGGLIKMKKEEILNTIKKQAQDVIEDIAESVIEEVPEADKTEVVDLVNEVITEWETEVINEVVEELGVGGEKELNEIVIEKLTEGKEKVKKKVLAKLKEKEEEGEEEEKEEKKEASEKKVIMMDEKVLKMLELNAKEGVKAMAELRRAKVESYIESKTFSEKNHFGPILPKSKDKVIDFMLTLSEEQVKGFKDFIEGLLKVNLFAELGKGEIGEESPHETLIKLAEQKRKENPQLTLRQSYNLVFSENPELAKEIEKGR